MAGGEPTLEQLLGRRDPPPLRVHHILVATAVVAVLLSLHHMLRQHDVGGMSKFLASVQGIVLTIMTGIAATVVAFGIAWRCLGHSFFDQPGHWLLLTQSLPVSLFLLAALLSTMRLPDNHVVARSATIAVFGLMNVLVIGLNLWAAMKIADSTAWTLIFLIDGLLVVSFFGLAC
jgi:hypothetical protein